MPNAQNSFNLMQVGEIQQIHVFVVFLTCLMLMNAFALSVRFSGMLGQFTSNMIKLSINTRIISNLYLVL